MAFRLAALVTLFEAIFGGVAKVETLSQFTGD